MDDRDAGAGVADEQGHMSALAEEQLRAVAWAVDRMLEDKRMARDHRCTYQCVDQMDFPEGHIFDDDPTCPDCGEKPCICGDEEDPCE